MLDALDAALEANRELAELAERQRAEIAGLREQNARLLEREPGLIAAGDIWESGALVVLMQVLLQEGK